ncbi:hypothetical protein J6590_066877 [Homalodisca vitripennis]|nr:hypothetical protein J6590_066877 [Homalodisca vitripennis]
MGLGGSGFIRTAVYVHPVKEESPLVIRTAVYVHPVKEGPVKPVTNGAGWFRLYPYNSIRTSCEGRASSVSYSLRDIARDNAVITTLWTLLAVKPMTNGAGWFRIYPYNSIRTSCEGRASSVSYSLRDIARDNAVITTLWTLLAVKPMTNGAGWFRLYPYNSIRTSCEGRVTTGYPYSSIRTSCEGRARSVSYSLRDIARDNAVITTLWTLLSVKPMTNGAGWFRFYPYNSIRTSCEGRASSPEITRLSKLWTLLSVKPVTNWAGWFRVYPYSSIRTSCEGRASSPKITRISQLRTLLSVKPVTNGAGWFRLYPYNSIRTLCEGRASSPKITRLSQLRNLLSVKPVTNGAGWFRLYPYNSIRTSCEGRASSVSYSLRDIARDNAVITTLWTLLAVKPMTNGAGWFRIYPYNSIRTSCEGRASSVSYSLRDIARDNAVITTLWTLLAVKPMTNGAGWFRLYPYNSIRTSCEGRASSVSYSLRDLARDNAVITTLWTLLAVKPMTNGAGWFRLYPYNSIRTSCEGRASSVSYSLRDIARDNAVITTLWTLLAVKPMTNGAGWFRLYPYNSIRTSCEGRASSVSYSLRDLARDNAVITTLWTLLSVKPMTNGAGWFRLYPYNSIRTSCEGRASSVSYSLRDLARDNAVITTVDFTLS